MGVTLFRETVKQFMHDRNWRFPQLAAASGYDRTYLWELVVGRRNKIPSFAVVADLDKALDAVGQVIAAWQHSEVDDMHRRDFLLDAGFASLIATLTASEGVRHQVLGVLAETTDPVERWERVVAGYAHAYYLASPTALLTQLMADQQALSGHIASTPEHRAGLLRAAACLAGITAMTWNSLGQPMQALRWWDTARAAADASDDTRIRVQTRALELVNGTYEMRPYGDLQRLGEDALALAGERVDVAAAHLWGGMAQAQAIAGHPGSTESLRRLAEITEQVPASAANDYDTIYGWPEVRLRHTQSFVYTAAGDTTRAYAAQETALALYGDRLLTDRAKVQLHGARCQIIDKDISGGLASAHKILDDYPGPLNNSLRTVAANVLTALPASESRRSNALALHSRIWTTS